jgi:hypothetical protein
LSPLSDARTPLADFFSILLVQHLVLWRRNHEQETSVVRRGIVVYGSNLGAMVIPNRHLTTGDIASAFEYVKLFHCRVTMRGRTGARCKPEE